MTQPLPLKAGDVVVESVGNIIRLWTVGQDSLKLHKIGESRTFNRRRFFMPAHQNGIAVLPHRAAPDLTMARVFPRKPEGWEESARMVRDYAGALPWSTVHYFYSSFGPSGTYWGMARYEGEGARHRSVAGCAAPVPEDSDR